MKRPRRSRRGWSGPPRMTSSPGPTWRPPTTPSGPSSATSPSSGRPGITSGGPASFFEDLARRQPGDTAHREGLARTFNGLAILERVTNEPISWARRRAAMFDAIDRSCALWEGLSLGSPDSAAYRAGLARAVNSRGVALRTDLRLPEAIASLERSRDLHRDLVGRLPAVTTYREELGRTCNNLGAIYRLTGRRGESALRYTEARELYDGLARENPSASEFRMELANSWSSLGGLDHDAGRADQAVGSLRAAGTSSRAWLARSAGSALTTSC